MSENKNRLSPTKKTSYNNDLVENKGGLVPALIPIPVMRFRHQKGNEYR